MNEDELIDATNADLPDRTSASQPRVEISAVRQSINRAISFAAKRYKFEVPNGDGLSVPTQASESGFGFLTIVGNMVAGLKDLAFLNTNIRSRVFSFWYYIDGNLPRLAMILRENRAGFGGITQPQEIIDADGRMRSWGLVAAGGKPTAATLGSGLGSSGSIAMDATATDQAGRFAITTGNNPSAGQMARITFAKQIPRTPVCVICTPADPDAAMHYSKVILYPEFATGLVLASSGSDALPANTTLEYNYQVIV